ncbi:hypothetical protein ABMA27_008828 [Loxostege sticticalis]|uniref:Uncharacterized protein n=1 Tax=Loxostege sticticalis TaxID=481309 RepID=A0ABR3H8Z0_LOXSC
MEEQVVESLPNKARKRRRAPNTWKRAKAKIESHLLVGTPNCNHNVNDKHLHCKRLSLLDIAYFHEVFYKTKNKKDQDAFILRHCKVTKCKRRRPRRTGLGLRKPTQHVTKLFVHKRNSVKLLRVYQKTIVCILNITVQRVRTVSRTLAATGSVVTEKRGGDHTSAKNVHKLRAVKRFIESFQCLESHYCRSSVIRKYLPSTLNIRKMWKIYIEQCSQNTKVKESYFRSVFNRCYNLGFGSPQYRHLLKMHPIATLMAEKRVHNLKAEAFYRLLKERKEDMVVFSFDCQKNQVLPKIPDQAAYYSRQLYIYNFAIVKSVPGNILGKDNVTLYTWTEDEHRKGANEIASAVYDRLQTTIFSQNINTIRFIEFVFPIPGHSFIPRVRVFGLIEKEIKCMENIISPQEYMDIYKNHGTVIHFDNVLDWKSALTNVMRSPGNWHFAFSQMKRFYLRRNKSNGHLGQLPYKGWQCPLGTYRSVLKRRMTFLDVRPDRINKLNVLIKKEKLRDVDNLLTKHYARNGGTELT